jgi:2-polyprenyl-3-methyl-5-hydroxy-6-metoxy-1,4-benzoquinol methylase
VAKNQISPCPICAQQMHLLFRAPCDYRKPTIHKSYDVHWCVSCDYGQVWQRPSKEQISSFYDIDNYYTHKENTNHETRQISKFSFLDKLRIHLAWRLDNSECLSPKDVSFLLKTDSLSMLDIGCGNGENMASFLDCGFSVVGVEPDPKARQVATKSNYIVHEGTAEELPLAILDRKYDVILISHVLEHCMNINTAVSNAKNLLNRGGVLIVETPNCQSLGFKAQKAAWPWSDIPRHLNFFTRSSLDSALSKHGLRVVSVKYQGFCRQFLNSWLNTEEEIFNSFQMSSDQWKIKPNYQLRAWKLLISSIFASKELKYDSVRVIAQLI